MLQARERGACIVNGWEPDALGKVQGHLFARIACDLTGS
jgi:hypothetical protein